MKLILLYGPPAVGKLTIARELSLLTNIAVFHNHMILNPLREIFGLEHPARAKLEFEFRLRIIEEAIAANKDLIMTGVITMKNYRAFYEQAIEMVKKSGGKVCMVQLIATNEVLQERVSEKSRGTVGKINSKEKWEEFAGMYPEIYDTFSENEHLKIDTEKFSPEESAQKISDYYDLT